MGSILRARFKRESPTERAARVAEAKAADAAKDNKLTPRQIAARSLLLYLTDARDISPAAPGIPKSRLDFVAGKSIRESTETKVRKQIEKMLLRMEKALNRAAGI